MKGYFKKIMRLTLIMLLLSAPLWNSCKKKKEETPQPPLGCGVGAGDYKFYVVNGVPDNFDCNDSGRFVIAIRPKINPSYGGTPGVIFNRLYFVLDGIDNIYISNYVEFLSGNTADQQLEWGGSVPTGDFKVRGRMKNIQLNSTCLDSLKRDEYKDFGWIHITQFTNPQKVMQIEYDCQLADTLFYRFDIFDICSWLDERMDIAFNIANTTYNIIEDNKDLPTEPVIYEDPWTEFRRYIVDHKDNNSLMYLCGIKRFVTRNGIPLSIFGATQTTWDFHPDSVTGSLIAVKYCIDWSAGEYDINYNYIITATVIHELGLQRAIRYEGIECTSPFCIMFSNPIYSDRSTYMNPHFCEHCLDLLRNIQW
jgi:hypothetical protein